MVEINHNYPKSPPYNIVETEARRKRLEDADPSQKTTPVPRAISSKAIWRLFIICLVISDGLATGLAFRAAYFVRFEISLGIFQPNITPVFSYYQRLVMFLIPLWLVIFAVEGLYNREKLLGGTEEYSLTFTATTVGMFAVISVGFFDPSLFFARGWLILAWGFSFIFIAAGRFFLRRGIYFLRKQGYFLSNAIIIGANSEGQSLADQLMSWSTSGLNLLGFIDKKIAVGTPIHRHLRVLGTVDDLDELMQTKDIEEIIIASSSISSRDRIMDIFQRYGTTSHVNLRMSSGLYEIVTTGMTVKEFAYVPLVGINKVRLTGVDQILKILLDFFITIPSLLFVLPLLAIIGIIIKLDSPGPVIYRRRVMGVNGRQFDAFKLRTMYTNGNQILSEHTELRKLLAESHKLKNDPRITRVGQFLRKTSLDELPQLINVLKGDMSLVGPRIITAEEVEKYDRWDINLMTVRPGLTGLWQVSGRSNVSYSERVRLDMYYIRNWSIWADIQILFQTVPAVLKRTGAY